MEEQERKYLTTSDKTTLDTVQTIEEKPGPEFQPKRCLMDGTVTLLEMWGKRVWASGLRHPDMDERSRKKRGSQRRRSMVNLWVGEHGNVAWVVREYIFQRKRSFKEKRKLAVN
jgi:hypothetical protein